YPPSPRVPDAIRAALGESAQALRLYPEPTSLRLREVLAARYGLTAENVFVGNGSDEVLAHTFQALLKHERPIRFPDITYSFYPTYARLYGVAYETVPVDDEFAIRVDDYLAPSGGVLFANPNAPTGRALPLAEIERLVASNRESVVVVDEAYVDFGADSAASLVTRYPNLLVVQTFSKGRSLAGMRVGMAFGDAALIDALTRVKDSFNSYPLDRLAQAAALASIEDEAWFEDTRGKVMASREHLSRALIALGFEVLPSQANFVFAKHPGHSGRELAQMLKEKGIFVRRFDLPRIEEYLRITVGTDAQCDALVAALRRHIEP
ncbi:pyridoxal phosphate-dependent aminotransferase, partial [Trinickia caryophylli]